MIVQVKSVQPQPTYVHRLISDLSRAIVLLIASFCAIAFADPPTDLPETVAKSVLTDSGAWGIAPEGSISVMYPMGSTPPQIEDSKGAGYTTVTLSGRALDVRTQLVWFFPERQILFRKNISRYSDDTASTGSGRRHPSPASLRLTSFH